MHRPDLPGWRKQIWVDCMDVDAPFLLQLGRITNDESYVDQGLNEILGYARALQVESNSETDGLFWHGYEEDCGTNGQLWARQRMGSDGARRNIETNARFPSRKTGT